MGKWRETALDRQTERYVYTQIEWKTRRWGKMIDGQRDTYLQRYRDEMNDRKIEIKIDEYLEMIFRQAYIRLVSV